MAFSKLAEPYDQEVADMMFIDFNFENASDVAPIYYIDGELIAIFEDEIVKVETVESVFNYLIKIMRREYEWYYDEEYTRVMDHIRATGGNKDKVLRLIYDEMDYPTLRDSQCTYDCEGCQIKHVCMFCSGSVSHCASIRNENPTGTTYYCDDDCYTAFWREEYKPILTYAIEQAIKRGTHTVGAIRSIDNSLKQKGKLIHLQDMQIQGKSSILRTELELIKKIERSSFTIQLTERVLYEALLERDKPSFLLRFTELQEHYDEKMQLLPTSQQVLDWASHTKDLIGAIHRYAHIFLGIQEE
jgi:hypothetical protein